jgi:hypothetical protein
MITKEAALRRLDVSDEMAQEHLQRLIEDRSHVNVRVLPFSVGIHGGMVTGGSSEIMDFSED